MDKPVYILHLEDNPRSTERLTAALAGAHLDCQIQRVESEVELEAALRREHLDVILAEEKLQRHAQEMDALYEIMLKINTETEMSEVLSIIIERTAELVGAAWSGVYLLRPDGETLELTVNQALPYPINGSTLRLGEGLAGRIAQTGSCRIVEDYSNWEGRAQIYNQIPFQRVLGLPLKVNNHLIGVLEVSNNTDCPTFTEDEIRLLQLFADQMATAIEKARLLKLAQDELSERMRLEEAGRRQRARAEALVRTAARLNRPLDTSSLLQAICEETVRSLNVSGALVSLCAPALQYLTPAASLGVPAELVEQLAKAPYAMVERVLQLHGPVFSIPGLKAVPEHARQLPLMDFYNQPVTIALMIYEQKIIGALYTVQEDCALGLNDDEQALLKGLADQAALALTNAREYESAQRRLHQLEALSQIDKVIISSTDLDLTLKTIIKEVVFQLKVDAAQILLFDSRTQLLHCAAERGFRDPGVKDMVIRLGEGLPGLVAHSRETVYLPDLKNANVSCPRVKVFAGEEFVAYFGVPLIAKGQIKGVLELFHRSPLQIEKEWLDFLVSLCGQSAIAIDNITLFDRMERSNMELMLAYDVTIEGWSQAMDLRDKETEGHTRRVAETTMELAILAGVDRTALTGIRRGALLHDIGKLGVPDQILFKPGALTDEEWRVMRQHPQYAYDMLKPIAYLRPALDIPYCHHEKWDGTGYPRGLAGEQIPLAARLFSIVDVWDALASDRPYRAAWSPDEIRRYIQDQSGVQFDPRFTSLFIQMLDEAQKLKLPEPALAIKVSR